MNEFPEITSRAMLADCLDIPLQVLTYVLYGIKCDSCYTTFTIPKKNGGERTIHAPVEPLKGIQSQLAKLLWVWQKSAWTDENVVPRLSHAFEKGKGIITNASVHRHKRYVLNLDLESFFDAFHFGRVMGFFEKNRYFRFSREVAVAVAQLTCYQGRLPQGAPSSPIITNLICQILDQRLLHLARAYKLDYTRYADDLSFSTNDRSFPERKDKFLKTVTAVIEREGFSVNAGKTRLQFYCSRQMVTGLVVNRKISIPREFVRQTRAMAHRLYLQGGFEVNGVPGTLGQLEGRFSFIDQIERYNNRYDGAVHDLSTLNGRERQYQAFLFYKYFYGNDRPLIVTEGKTDVKYLTAALKNLYMDYPDLIERDDEGRFRLKVAFLKRSKRLRYFFGLGLDGADTMGNLYRFFVPCKDRRFPDYYDRFAKLCRRRAENPVFLLFDNEMSNKDKPLHKFVSTARLGEDRRANLQKDLYVQLYDRRGLFLLTHDLKDGKAECEIEDLFDAGTLAHEINGKRFSRESDYDKDRFYGKEYFSEYIAQNYSAVDFSGFRDLLNAINRAVALWKSSKAPAHRVQTTRM